MSPLFCLFAWGGLQAIMWMMSSRWIIIPTAADMFVNKIWGWFFLSSLLILVIGAFLLVDWQKEDNLKIVNIIRYARWKAKKHMHHYLPAFLMIVIVQVLQWSMQPKALQYDLFAVMIYSILSLWGFWLTLGIYKISLEIIDNKPIKALDIFVSLDVYWKAFVAYVITQIISVIWLVLLIVPGIIFTVRFAFAPYIIIESWMRPLQALKKSWYMTKWLARDILALNIILGLINLLWMVSLFVWLLRTVPLLLIANTYLYKEITKIRP
jgi:hypothetical protein